MTAKTKSRIGSVKEGVSAWWASLRPESPGALFNSASRGLPLAVAAVPDGMASATLVGVSPINGLYASFAGPLFGGLFTSSRLMVVATTSGASLAALSALSPVPDEDKLASLVVLTVLTGAFLILGGWLGAGRLTDFVSQSVMTGFLTGVGVNIILGQIPDLTGTNPDGSNSLFKAFGVLLDLGSIDGPTFTIGLGSIAALVLLERTKIGTYASLLVMVAASIVAARIGWFASVPVVSDISKIESGLPPLVMPDFGLIDFNLAAGAFAVAAIVMVQSAAISESYPNPDGTKANVSTDFSAQGWTNVINGLFRGIPVGGSVGSTAMSVAMGSRSRWAAITSGLWMLAVLVLFSSQAERVAMPALAAILMVASTGAIKPHDIRQVWRTGMLPRIAMVSTFLAVLLMPVAIAVAIGVTLSVIFEIGFKAQSVEVIELYRNDAGELAERPVPKRLEPHSVTVLNVYGSLFFAAAKQAQNELPAVDEAEGAIVILRMRGRDQLGATAMSIIAEYGNKLREVGGALWLSGVEPDLLEQFEESGRIAKRPDVEIYRVEDTIGTSTGDAIEDAVALTTGATHDRQTPPTMSSRLLRGQT